MIEFKTKNFRDLEINAIPHYIRDMDSSPLILIKKDGLIMFARTKTDKDTLMENLSDDDIVLFGWHGQYRTDIFTMTPQELREKYKSPDGKSGKEVPHILRGMS
jgi:hypothetical protein